MPRAPPPLMILLAAVALFLWYVVWTRDHERPMDGLSHSDRFASKTPESGRNVPKVATTSDALHGDHVMGKLGNETLKAELGQAAWKVLHTTMARFPDKPTHDESDALKSYIYLFARLYPCGECAEHFQQILKKYPPQTSSRSSAAAWACFVHNVVNESKGKPIFDCANIGDFYDCGCADEEKEEISKAGKISDVIANPRHEHVEIEVEGETRGG
jgi:FAD-linked sulfhydryl oxidase